MSINKKETRLGETRINNDGCIMKIIEYNNANDMVVEFQDKYAAKVHTAYQCFMQGCINNPMLHIGESNYSHQGCLMKIVEYNSASDVIVEFQDKYKAKMHTQYHRFLNGSVKNPYAQSVCGVGITGKKYPASLMGRDTKEYSTWRGMLYRCFDKKTKERNSAYKNATCNEEWLLYEIFYEWFHKQDNFDKWYNGKMWALDKDIIKKGNNIYSANTCCLVPQGINSLFVKNDALRSDLPIGVEEVNGKFRSIKVHDVVTGKLKGSCLLSTPEEAFQIYKMNKEAWIKHVAETEFSKGNITKKCRDAMIGYKIEIND